MNQFKKSKTIVVVSAIVLLSLSLLFVSSQGWFRRTKALAPINYAVSSVDGLLAAPANLIYNLGQEMSSLLDTYRENKELKASMTETADLAAENASLQSENESLRQALAIDESYADKTRLPAAVLSRNPNSWSETVSINKGSHHGVTKDMLVMANGGLIGILTEVDVTSSRVQLLTDQARTKNLAVKINLESGAVYGILTRYDEKKKVFIISQLNSDKGISENSQVVTSDLSDEAASNVLVGKVSAIKKNGNTLDTELHVKPAADFSNIHAAVLVKN